MCQTEESGYTNVMFPPSRFDSYLVKTVEGCYDFALFDTNGWHKGKMTDGNVHYWMETPKHKSILEEVES